MRDCKYCKYAAWKRTTNGRLHPDKSGRCTYPVKVPALPQAFYWISTPSPCGGHIERGRPLNDHCAYYHRVTE